MHLMCAICTELVNEDDHIVVTPCGHIYHHQCVEPWVRSSQNCPQCRESLTEASLVRIFPSSDSNEDAASAIGSSSLDITEETAPQETVESLNRLLSSVREDLSARNNDVVLLQAQLHSMEEAHERETMTLAEALRRNAETTRNQLNSTEQKIIALTQQLHTSNAESIELRSESLDLRNRLQQVESDLRSTKSELADSQRTVVDLDQHLDGAKKKANILKETNQSLEPNMSETVSNTLNAVSTAPESVTVTAVPTTKAVDSPEIYNFTLRRAASSVEAVPNSPASVPKSLVPTPRPRSI